MARLSDLYKVEKQIVVSDGETNIPIVVRKVSPIQMDTIRRRAKATQVLVEHAKSRPDSELFLEQLGNIEDVLADDRDELLGLVVESHLAKRSAKIQAKVMEGDGSEWAKDDYLKSLFEAWDGGMSERFAEDETDVDAKKVQDEIERFTEEVDRDLEEERDRLRDELSFTSIERLKDYAAEILLERVALTMWHDEFVTNRVFFATRNDVPERSQYFDDLDEVRGLDERVLQKIDDVYEEMSVDPLEGKDLPQPQSSSQQPESEKTAATQTSGPKLVQADSKG